MYERTLEKMALTLVGLAAFAQAATAEPILPDPNLFAQQFDDGFSYPVGILERFFPDDGWDTAAGTGTLDVLITTRSSGQTNPDGFPDPTTNPNTNPISDMWGTSATTGDLLVSDVLDYLVTTFNTTVPQFTFDQNETGTNPDLYVTAKVEIVDPTDGVLYTWAFDGTEQPGDGTYDEGDFNDLSDPDWILAPGEITIADDPQNPGNPYTINNNLGSGKFDYIIVAPTMDLTAWADADNLFKVSWQFADVDDGGEEITLTGRFFRPPTNVPEPASTALVSLGLLLLGSAYRRRNNEKA